MKKLAIIGLFALSLNSISCSLSKARVENRIESKIENKVESTVGGIISRDITAKGVVTSITNGKDGYMAYFDGKDNKSYIATVSKSNLSKNGQKYKKYKVGEKITVKGSSWNDKDGTIHIMAKSLK